VRGGKESGFTDLLPRQRLSGGLVSAPESPTITGTCPHDHLGEEWSTTINWSLGAFKIYNYGNGPSIWGWNGGNGNGIRGYATGTGLGVYGESIGNSGVFGRSTNGNGVEGVSTSGTGVQGQGALYGVYSEGSLYVNGNIYASGSKTGYVVDIAQNDDLVPLEVGDLVVISGAGPAVLGEIPVIQVRRATTRGRSAIVGVVDKRFSIEPAGKAGDEITRISTDDEPINPGDYLTIVTLGAFKAIKVDASYGAIAPGDLLVASPNPGYAMHADSPQAGSIIGKALEALPSGTGLIPVMVDLQ
jgi:hypothetical protein